MKKMLKYSLQTSALLIIYQGVFAESSIITGAGPITATARLDIQVTIPKVLFLQVGTGTLMANNATVDLIQFNVPAASVGNGTAIAGTGGDLGLGVVTAKVIGNGGNVSLLATTTSALTNATADTISYSKITTTATTLTTGTVLAAPTLLDGGPSASITLTAVAKIVNQDARWTYTYLNNTVPSPGTYGGTAVNGGRVTYTASLP